MTFIKVMKIKMSKKSRRNDLHQGDEDQSEQENQQKRPSLR
ncbi:hypothetical protein [Oceanobacillus damuensis]|nr:hypothetical protein [Oceanobacillus damuensis]